MQNPPDSSPNARAVPWIAVVVMVVASLALVAYLKTGQAIVHTGQAIKQTAEIVVAKVPEIAARFKTGTITNTFLEENVTIARSKGGVLETTTPRANETFKHQDTLRVFWDMLNLGTTTSEIRVPATFRYHIQLSDPWKIAVRDHTCLVLAPAFRPSLPVAIHTDLMEKQTQGGWMRFNADDNLQELERTLTSELNRRAADPKHLALAREASRQTVAEFVKTWLLRDDFWRQDRFSSIVVVFPDELPAGADRDLEQYQHDPTIQFEQKN